MAEKQCSRFTALRQVLVAAGLVLVVVIRFYFYTFKGNITGFFHIGSGQSISPYLADQTLLNLSSG